MDQFWRTNLCVCNKFNFLKKTKRIVNDWEPHTFWKKKIVLDKLVDYRFMLK